MGLHEVRLVDESGGESTEHHALRFEILPDRPIGGFGFLECPEAREDVRFADLGDGGLLDRLRRDHPVEVDLPQERGPTRDSLRMQSFQGAKSEAQHPVRLAARFREVPDHVRTRSRANRDETACLLGGGPGSVRGHDRHSRETVSCFRSRAASRVCQARLAHLTRTGNSHTPDRTASFPRELSTGSPGRAVTILWNRSKRPWASAFDLPFTASVIKDADAFEMAHPWPMNEMSAIVPSSRRRYTVTRSPHSGLCPTAFVLASAISRKLRGLLLWSRIVSWYSSRRSGINGPPARERGSGEIESNRAS